MPSSRSDDRNGVVVIDESARLDLDAWDELISTLPTRRNIPVWTIYLTPERAKELRAILDKIEDEDTDG